MKDLIESDKSAEEVITDITESVSQEQFEDWVSALENNLSKRFKLGRPNLPRSVPDFIPEGWFKVKRAFSISPGGGWRLPFEKDTMIYSDGKGEVFSYTNKSIKNGLQSFNPFVGIKRVPPISGTKELKITQYGRQPEQKDMWESFANNVSPLEGDKALEMIKSKAKNFVQ